MGRPAISSVLLGRWMSPVKLAAAGTFILVSAACSGSVEMIEAESEDTMSAGGTGGSETWTGGTGGVEATGGIDGTGGEPYVPPECPDEPPPPVEHECDPLDPLVGCPEGYGCYPYLEYPSGEDCGHPTFGAICAPASTGEHGDFCGEGVGYCAPGFMCVVGAAGGRRCGQICAPVADHDCPDGLICGRTDVDGYGVCY